MEITSLGSVYSLRWRVFERDRFTCQYCGRKAPDVVLEIDHVTPISIGGETTAENLKTACSACNQGKNLFLRVITKSGTHQKRHPKDESPKTISRMAWDALEDGGKTVAHLASLFDRDSNVVRMTLNRLASRGYVANIHGLWSRVSD